mmetsp:Transcript_23893/g.40888  ORF Transcript_23893/g.40888 Transcript_23893/m.40888 type:complete len:213 (-) Transcript_23893:365-1003(-)
MVRGGTRSRSGSGPRIGEGGGPAAHGRRGGPAFAVVRGLSQAAARSHPATQAGQPRGRTRNPEEAKEGQGTIRHTQAPRGGSQTTHQGSPEHRIHHAGRRRIRHADLHGGERVGPRHPPQRRARRGQQEERAGAARRRGSEHGKAHRLHDGRTSGESERGERSGVGTRHGISSTVRQGAEEGGVPVARGVHIVAQRAAGGLADSSDDCRGGC